MYYARTENDEGKRESFQHHLLRVAQLARMYGEDLNCENEAEITGLLHDFGKYSKLFQGVLDGTEQRVNHEAAGAMIAVTCYGKGAMTVARAIFGHHKGLEYDIEPYLKDSVTVEGSMDKHNRRYALSGRSEYQESFKVLQSEIELPKMKFSKNDYSYCKNKNIAEMLHTRMLFSCLVDADYSSSAEHYDNNYISKSTGGLLKADEILEKLHKYRENIRKQSKSNKEINKIRDELFNFCIEAAEKSPGLFTLTAPTGTGKTLSLLAFALAHAEKYKKKRIILVLPFLSIIEQNAQIYREICGNIFEDHSQSEYDEESRYYSERWDYPVIVTTSVKFFEALFKHQPVDCRKLHNIANSVIVFDEAQSLPPHLTGVTLDSINALCRKYNCSVVFSTATQPSFKYRSDTEWKPVEIVYDPQKLYDGTRRVNVEWRIKETTDFKKIAQEMSKLNSCCTIVNMKRHSVKLFNVISKLCDKESIFHISTDMCAAHRTDTINEIKKRLKSNLPCRIVSTQCIEAGVDLDVDVVFRALAPLDSIIQSAGRCNRNGIHDKGQVVVFKPDEEGTLYPDDYYEYAANIVLSMLLSNNEIDINNLKHIDEYYKRLFSGGWKDDRKLLDAIGRVDFEETDQYYKLIKQRGVNVIVPYRGKIKLYNEIREYVLNEGLTPAIMKKAREITVSNYNTEKVEELCERLYFKGSYGRKGSATNWFILTNESLYDDYTGLQITKDTVANYTF